ncbi:hypothetical protein VTI74DRAFT_5830 [Chaetomium olivicolor]
MHPAAMNAHRDDDIEAEPLLAAEERDSVELADAEGETEIPELPVEPIEPDHGKTKGHGRRRFGARFQARKRSSIAALLAVLMFAVTSGILLLIPMFRLMEDAICHAYYKKGMSEPIEEGLCKVDEVQKELAYLGGLSGMLHVVVTSVASLPYGVVADRVGRKPAFALAYAGAVLAFGWGPLMLVIGEIPHVYLAPLGSIFFLIGGGIPAAINVLHSMMSDISSETERSSGFLCLSFGAVLGTLIGPVAAGLLMEHLGPWFPILAIFCIAPLTFGLLLFLPETLPIKLKGVTESDAQQSLAAKMREAASELGVSFSLLKNRNIPLFLPVFLISPALFAAYSSTLAQHMSTYFGWTLAQTNYLLSPLTLLNLVIIVILPNASGFLTNPSGRFRLSVFSKDLLLAKVSLLFLIAGAVIEGCSRSVAPFLLGLTVGTFGSSNGPMCRAAVTAYVEPHQTSRLFALITLVETSGAILGGPVLAWCFSVGLSRKGAWIGLPWFYVAGLVLAALAPLMFLRKPKDKDASADSENEANGDMGYQSGEEPV